MSERAKLTGPGRLEIYCPACRHTHAVRVPLQEQDRPKPEEWGWNFSTFSPTLTPSLNAHYPAGDPLAAIPVREYKCHSYVENGKIRFLDDSTHALKGQVVDLPTWPYDDDGRKVSDLRTGDSGASKSGAQE